MKTAQNELNEQWERELLARIEELEQTEADDKGMTKRDYLEAMIITLVCFCALIIGAFL